MQRIYEYSNGPNRCEKTLQQFVLHKIQGIKISKPYNSFINTIRHWLEQIVYHFHLCTLSSDTCPIFRYHWPLPRAYNLQKYAHRKINQFYNENIQ
jgi:predicted transcriptional regulator